MEKDTLLIKPIRFTSIKHIGSIGSDWIETEYNLSKLITQNILYAAYHKAKTIDEISSLLGLEKRIVINEIDYLEDNGYMIMVEKGKYLSQIIIDDFPQDILEKRDKLFSKYAAVVYDEYISQISAKSFSLYSPQNDQNFLLWSIITILCFKKIHSIPPPSPPHKHGRLSPHIYGGGRGGNDDVYNETQITCERGEVGRGLIKRNDGSENIPYTTISNYENKKSFIEYDISLKTHKGNKFSILQTNSIYDDRYINWSQIFQQEYHDLYEYINNKDECKPETIKKLLNKGYLLPENNRHCEERSNPENNRHCEERSNPFLNKYFTNIVVSDISKKDCFDMLPPIPDSFVNYNKELQSELCDICYPFYPPHILEFTNILYQNSLSLGEIVLKTIEIAIKNNLLKPLTELQKRTVNMIVFLNNN